MWAELRRGEVGVEWIRELLELFWDLEAPTLIQQNWILKSDDRQDTNESLIDFIVTNLSISPTISTLFDKFLKLKTNPVDVI